MVETSPGHHNGKANRRKYRNEKRTEKKENINVAGVSTAVKRHTDTDKDDEIQKR